MKKRCVFLLLVILLLAFTGCTKTLNQIIDDEPHFTGTVLKVSEYSILVEADEGEDILRSGDLIDVSLNIEYEDGKSTYHVGDRVTVYYNGEVAESYPLQVHNVYAVFIIEPADRTQENVG